MISPLDAWVLSKLLSGCALNGELDSLQEPWKAIGSHLDGLPPPDRLTAFQTILLGRTDHKELVSALAAQNPNGPAPVAPKIRAAHLGDLSQASGRFVWDNHIVRGHLNIFSSDPKCGKTRVMMDIAKRIFFALPWPDKQQPAFPAKTRTIWIPGDRHQDELKDLAVAYGMPEESVLFNALPSSPYGGWDLDNPENVELLRNLIDRERPGLVIIDTVWRATRRKLFRETEVNELFDPLLTMAQDLDVTIMGLMHLSKDSETLGRRLEGMARAIWKMFRPDPAQPNRRRLQIVGNFREPEDLGVTIKDDGCDYDDNPPTTPEPKKRGRPSLARESAVAFIRNSLAKQNDQIGNDLCELWEQQGGNDKTFWRATDDMEVAGDIAKEGGPGTGKQTILRFVPKPSQNP